MQRTLVTTVILAALWCSISQGGTLYTTAINTPELLGFKTITVLYDAYLDESFRGVDATFTGTINQINPFGLATIFTDNNFVIPEGGVSQVVQQDSHFLFRSSDVLSIGAEEGAGILKGAISGLNQLGLPNPTAFAQIVTNRPCDVEFSLEIDNGRGGELWAGSFSEIICLPEPNSGALVGLALAFVGRCRLRSIRHLFAMPIESQGDLP